jgi:hypothetical protein
MSEDRSPFEVLGIEPGDDFAAARQRYRKLARQYHPDRSIGDPLAERKFKEVQSAWDAIKHRLPREFIAFPDDADATDFDDKIGQWLLSLPDDEAETAAPPPKRSRARPTGSALVSAEEAGRMRALRDWRTLVVSGLRPSSTSLVNIEPFEAQRLYEAFPNSFAGLAVLQRDLPELCLHDAIKACFDPTSLVDARTEPRHWHAALLNPLESIQHAIEHAGKLAPYIAEGRTAALNPKKLAIDLWCLKCCVEELAPRISRRPGPPGTAVTVQW